MQQHASMVNFSTPSRSHPALVPPPQRDHPPVESDKCVYVKESVLSQLETEKRTLQWQLAQSDKLCDVRQAQVVTAEAKLQDLMAIVQLNKHVASKHKHNAYNQQVHVQQLTQKKLQMEQAFRTRHKMLQQKFVCHLHQRRVLLTRHRVFQVFLSDLRAMQHKMQLARRKFRTRLVRKVFDKWKQVVLMLHTKQLVDKPRQQQVHQTLQEFVHLRSRMRCQLQLSTFSAWKRVTICRPNDYIKARLWYQRRLTATVFHVWNQRWYQQRRVHQFMARRRQLALGQSFGTWKQQVQDFVTRVRCLHKLPSLVLRRILRHALHQWRFAAMELRANEWIQVLQAARTALEEEKLNNQQLSQVKLEQIHVSHQKLHHQRSSLRQTRLEQMRLAYQLQSQRICFVTWRRIAMQRHLQAQLATQVSHFYRYSYLRRIYTKCFTGWRHQALQRHETNQKIHRQRHHTEALRVARAFEFWKRHVQRIRRFQTICKHLQHRLVMKSFWKRWYRWKYCMIACQIQLNTMVDAKMNATAHQQLERQHHQLLLKTQKRLAVSQMQSSFLMLDLRTTKTLHRILTSWKARTSLQRRQKRMVWRLGQCIQKHLTRKAWTRWNHQRTHGKNFTTQLRMIRSIQDKRVLLRFWQAWKRFLAETKSTTRSVIVQHAVFRVWRFQVARDTLRQSLLKRWMDRLVRKTTLRAMIKWHQVVQSVHHQLVCRQRIQLNRIRRIWMKWQLFVKNSMRCKAFCHRQMALKVHQTNCVDRCFVAWKQLHQQHQQIAHFRVNFFHQQRDFLRRTKVWKAWQHQAVRSRLVVQRLGLLLKGQLHRIRQQAWNLWKQVDRDTQLHRLRLQLTAAQKRFQWYERSGVKSREKRFLCGQCWQLWRHQVEVRRQRRRWMAFAYDKFQQHLVSRVFHTWKHYQLQQHHDDWSDQRRRSLLHVLITHKCRRMQSMWFYHWKLLSFMSTNAIRTTQRCHRRVTLHHLTNVTAMTLTTRRLRKCVNKWRKFACDRNRMATRIWCLWQIAHTRIQAFVWQKWKSQTQQVAQLERFVQVVQRSWCRSEFTHWRLVFLQNKAQTLVLKRLVRLKERCSLRHGIRQWHQQQYHQLKRVMDNQLTRHEVQAQNLMDHLLGQRHHKTYQARCFHKWREFVLHRRLKQTRQRHHQLVWIGQLFVKWKAFVARRQRLRAIFWRFGHQNRISCVRDAFVQWKLGFCQFQKLHLYHKRQMQVLRSSQVIQQTALSQKYAVLLYNSWQKPCLISVFTRWKVFVRVVCVQMQAQAMDFHHKRQHKKLVQLLRAWRYMSNLHQQVKKLVTRRHMQWTFRVWHAWRRFCRMTQLERVQLTKLMVVLRNGCQRHAFGKWKDVQQAHFKRQSMMLLESAQQALKKQQQDHLLQKVAFFFQSKQKTDLRRHFSEWHAVCQCAKKRQELADALRHRMTRRWLRGLLRQWLLTSVKLREEALIWKKLRALWHQRTVAFWFRTWQKYVVVCHQRVQLMRRILARTKWNLQRFGLDTWTRFLMNCKWEQMNENYRLMHAAQQQQHHQMNELTRKHSLLIDQSSSTRDCLNTLRSQVTCTVVGKLHQVIHQYLLRNAFAKWNTKTRQYHRFVNWMRWVEQFQLHSGFNRWHDQVVLVRNQQLKREQEAKQHHQMHKMIVLMNTSNDILRLQKFWWGWKQFVNRTRTKQHQAMLRIKVIHQLNRMWFRMCFKTWQMLWSQRKIRKSKVQLIEKTVHTKRLFKCFRTWKQCVGQLTCRKQQVQHCLQVLNRLIEVRQHEWLAKFFGHWKHRMVLDQLERQFRVKQIVFHLCKRVDTTSLQALFHWRLTTQLIAQQQQSRIDLFVALKTRKLLAQCLGNWRKQLGDHKRLGRVDQVTDSAHEAHAQPEARISPRKYHGRVGRPVGLRVARPKAIGPNWTLKRRHDAILKSHQLVALNLLVRAAQKHTQQLVRRFFWRWFCKSQTFSSTLVEFEPLLFRSMRPNAAAKDGNRQPNRPNVHAFGALVLILCNELQLVRHLLVVEKKQLVLTRLVLLVILSRRLSLQRAFCKWKWRKPARALNNNSHGNLLLSMSHATHCKRALDFSFPRRPQLRALLPGPQPKALACVVVSPSGKRVRAKACLQKLALVLQRKFFGVWKWKYIEAALRQAQLAETRLLLALEHQQQQQKLQRQQQQQQPRNNRLPTQIQVTANRSHNLRSIKPTSVKSNSRLAAVTNPTRSVGT